MAITDLTNTKWIISTIITATAGYGNFSINTSYTYINNGNTYNGTCNGLRVGYYDKSGDGSWSSKSDNVYLTYSDMPYLKLGRCETTIEITGGADVKNTSLISWLNSNATQVVEPEYTLRIDGVEVTDYENVIINGVRYKCKQVSVPTDLTGYTVTVPSGWIASAGYGIFSFNGYGNTGGYPLESGVNFQDQSSIGSFRIGYSGDFDGNFSQNANTIWFGPLGDISNRYEFAIKIIDGRDITNQTLIQWLVDNNATFEKESA